MVGNTGEAVPGRDNLGPGQVMEFESASAKLFTAIERLKTLTDLKTSWAPIGRARNMPAEERRIAERVRIDTRDDDKATVQAALEIQKQLATDYEARGHEKRRAALDDIAQEIDKLRVLLPDLTVDAVAEMGAIARMARQEAGK